jgi:hypothetical protein
MMIDSNASDNNTKTLAARQGSSTTLFRMPYSLSRADPNCVRGSQKSVGWLFVG